MTVELPDIRDVEVDAQVALLVTQRQRDGALSAAAFWQAAHAQLLAKHNQVVQTLTQRILEASQPAANDNTGEGDGDAAT